MHSSPFITNSDFNELSSHLDKMKGVGFRFSKSFFINHFYSSIECIEAIECVEFPFDGQPFTWRNKRNGPNYILERLDK